MVSDFLSIFARKSIKLNRTNLTENRKQENIHLFIT